PGAARQPVAHALVLCAIAIGMAIVVAAPGNAARMRMLGTDHGLTVRMLAGFPMTLAHVATFLFRRLTNPALIGWLVLLFLAAPPQDRLSPGPRPGIRASTFVWWPLAAAMIAIYGSLWIGHAATGRLLEQRALDYLHFILVGGLTLTTASASAAFAESVRRAVGRRFPRFNDRGIAIAGLLIMLATPHFLQAARILPHAVPFHQLVEDRFALLGGGKAVGAPIDDREIVVPASTTPNTKWFSDPVIGDANAWQNGCLARYIGVR